MEWSSISSTYVQSKQSVNGIINSQSKHVCTKWVIKYNLGKTLATYYLCQYLLIVDINYCYESMIKFFFFWHSQISEKLKPPSLVISILRLLTNMIPTWKMVPLNDIIEVGFKDPSKRKEVIEKLQIIALWVDLI